MKVKEIIKYFADKNPEEEILIQWWEREEVEDITEVKFTDEEWDELINQMAGVDFPGSDEFLKDMSYNLKKI